MSMSDDILESVAERGSDASACSESIQEGSGAQMWKICCKKICRSKPGTKTDTSGYTPSAQNCCTQPHAFPAENHGLCGRLVVIRTDVVLQIKSV